MTHFSLPVQWKNYTENFICCCPDIPTELLAKILPFCVVFNAGNLFANFIKFGLI
jgi:hypothetical protein